VDENGEVFVGGFWKPAGNPRLDFGCGELAGESKDGQQDDSYLAKLAPQGGLLACQWSTSIMGATGSSSQQLWNTVLDNAGNVIVVGEFTGNIDFDQDGSPDAEAAGDIDAFVARYDSDDGTLDWWRTFGAPSQWQGTSETVAYGATADGDGNILVVGRFHGADVSFGGDLLKPLHSDAFVVRLAAADGAHLHSANFGALSSPGDSFSNQFATYVAVDDADNVIVVGEDQDGLYEYGDILVFSLSTDLRKTNWARRFGNNDGMHQVVVGVDTLSDRDVVMAGWFKESLSLDGTDLTADGTISAFAARLRADDGSTEWAVNWGDTGHGAAVTSMAVDRWGHIVLGGWFYGRLDFGGSTGGIDSGHPGSKDAFLATLNANAGAPGVSVSGFGDDLHGLATGQAIRRVAVNGDGIVAVAGPFYGTIDLGDGKVACDTCDINGASDEFVATFNQLTLQPQLQQSFD